MIARSVRIGAVRPLSRLVPGLLLFALFGVALPSRASLVVNTAGVGNAAAFSIAMTASLEIGTDELGHQTERIDFSESGASAVLWYETVTPNSVGSSFFVHSYTRLSTSQDDIIGSLQASFSIGFQVDATQEYRLLGDVLNAWGNTDGVIAFDDVTANVTLFSAFFADPWYPYAANFNLIEGHQYQFTASLQGFLFPEEGMDSGREWSFQLAALPEPSTAVGLGVGAVALLGPILRRRAANGWRGGSRGPTSR